MKRIVLSVLVLMAPAAALAQGPPETYTITLGHGPSARTVEVPRVLDLETAQRIALEGNPSLQAAAQRVEQAKSRIAQARAEWYPRLDLSYSASVTEISDNAFNAARNAASAALVAGIPTLVLNQLNAPLDLARDLVNVLNRIDQARDAIDDTNESYRASLSASWLVFDGFGRKFRIAQARYGAQQSEAAYQETRRLILSVVARAYYGVQLARENILIAEADQAFNDRQLREAEARRRVGTGSLSDVLNFEIRVRAAQSSLLAAQRSYRVALIALAELMGLPDAAPLEGMEVAELHGETPEEMQPPELEQLIEYAMLNRPDLDQSRLRVDSAEAGIGARRALYWPTVSAFASRDAVRTRNGFFGPDDFSGTIGVSLNYNIYAGGRRRASLEEARAFRTEAELLALDAELVVASDVRQAVEVLSTAQKELVLQRQTTEFVERNRDLVEREYRAGQGSLVRLNEAQRDLIAQQSRLALARVALRQSWHDLRTATGHVLESYRENAE